MNKLALLLTLAALFLGLHAASAAPVPAPVLALQGVDIHGYTWDLSLDPATGAVSGTWDTTLVGCPVYTVVGSFSAGGSFQFLVSQSVTTSCDDTGQFVGTFDRATFTAVGTYVGNLSGGPHFWDWTF